MLVDSMSLANSIAAAFAMLERIILAIDDTSAKMSAVSAPTFKLQPVRPDIFREPDAW